jgi:hypothetical protein
MIKVSEFKSCVHEPPTETGSYLVVRLYNGQLSYSSNLNYTTEYGWNTYEPIEGSSWNISHRIDFNEGDYAEDYMWAKVTEENNE